MNDRGMGGISGTDDLRLIAFPLGGLGNRSVIFSSTVMLLVSLGSGLARVDAPLGRGGRGGSCVGLPGADERKDFLPKEPADLLRLWLGVGLWAGESAAFRGMGRGRLTTEAAGDPGMGAVLAASTVAPLMIVSTPRGSLYSMLFTNRMVLCCDPES
jgi:hypothetical protein